MSDNESSNAGSGMEEVVMYRCRHCPNEEFTAAERDLHRQQHKQQSRRRSGREGSPTVTIFEKIPVEDEGSTPKSPKRPRKKPGPKSKTQPQSSKEKKRKIRTNKKFDRHVEKVSNDGG